MRYRIRIRGHLDPAWSTWFDGLSVTRSDDGTTELIGPVVDQAALFGLLARVRDLGATLLLVEQLPATSAQERAQVPPAWVRVAAEPGARSSTGNSDGSSSIA